MGPQSRPRDVLKNSRTLRRTLPFSRSRLWAENLEQRTLLSTAYTITDLGTLPGFAASGALAVNNLGQVVGSVGNGNDDGGKTNGNQHAFLWTPGGRDGSPSNPQMRDLGTLGGSFSKATGINSAGQVVGWSYTSGSNPTTSYDNEHAFLWTRGGTKGPASNPQMQDLGTLGGSLSQAQAINNAGQVIGLSRINPSNPADHTSHAFLWTPGGTAGPSSNPQMQDLGTLGGSLSFGNGIDSAGEVAGGSFLPKAFPQLHAYLWTPGGTAGPASNPQMQDLGTLGGDVSRVNGINNSGQIAGNAQIPSGAQHAYLWTSTGTSGPASNPRMRDLGTLGGTTSDAFGINNAGQIVGIADTAGNKAKHAFLWSTGVFSDLNTLVPSNSNWTLSTASALNDLGRITGGGINPQGQFHAFVLTPVSSITSIGGVVFNDVNRNGIKDAGDVGLAGRSVYLDWNNDNIYELGEPIRATDSSGTYLFSNVSPGTFSLRTLLPSGVGQTTNAGNSIKVTVAVGQHALANIGEAALQGSISGIVFNDLNGNKIQDGLEKGLAGWTVFLDNNKNGKQDVGEPAVKTDALGKYGFVKLNAGSYRVREVLPTTGGWSASPAVSIDVALAAGQTLGGVNFADRQASIGSISGRVYNDANRNGIFDAGDSPLKNWTVFLDLNKDAVLESNDTATVTAADGTFTFSGLAAGAYRIREVVPGDATLTLAVPASGFYDVTLTAGQKLTGKDFANRLPSNTSGSISGIVFNDVNKNAVLDTTELGLAGRFVFLDTLVANGSWDAGEPATLTDPSGRFFFPGLAPGTYQVLAVLPPGTTQTTLVAKAKVTLGAGKTARVAIGQVATAGVGVVSGTVFNDANDNGRPDAGELGVAGRTIFLDLNADRVLEQDEPSAITDALGKYAFTNVAPGTYPLVQQVPQKTGPGSFYQTSSALYYQPTVLVKANLTTTVNFGDHNSTGTLANANFPFTVLSSVLQLDGKLVAVGYKGVVAAGTAMSVLARFNPDGSPDMTFGVKGLVVQRIGRHQSQANDVAIQSDGRIIVVGDSDMNFGYNGAPIPGNQVPVAGGSSGYIYRYSDIGLPDASLSKIVPLSGLNVTPQDPFGYLLHFNRVFILSGVSTNNFIMVFGSGARYTSGGKLLATDFSAVYRFTAAGGPDQSFGQNGYELLPAKSGDILTPNPAFAPDGAFVVPGQTHAPGLPWDFLLQQYDSKGNIKAYIPVDFSNRNDFATAATIQTDGNVVVVGFGYVAQNTTKSDFEITRLNTGGLPDSSFGGGTGKAIVDFGGNDFADDVQIVTDGEILISGHSTVGANTAPVAVLLTSSGVVDTTFGVKGKFIGKFTPTSQYLNADLRFLLSKSAMSLVTAPAVARGASLPSSIPIPPPSTPGSGNGVQPGTGGHGQPLHTDSVAPTGNLYSAPPVTSSGFGYYYFQVHFHDDHQVDLGSLTSQNITIVDSHGNVSPATFRGTFGSTRRKDVYAFYAVYPPGGSWDGSDNGTYQIMVQSNQVSDGTNYVPGSTTVTPLGRFRVLIASPGSISGTIFRDGNRNGIKDAGDKGIVNRYVYVDLNKNGRYDSDEAISLSDPNGAYLFYGLDAGSYVVRTYLPPGSTQTFPAGNAGQIVLLNGSNSAININFGEAP